MERQQAALATIDRAIAVASVRATELSARGAAVATLEARVLAARMRCGENAASDV